MPAGYAGEDARDFVRKHRPELEAEIDTGSGPRLYDLAIIAGCQDIAELGRRLHRRRSDVIGAPSSTDTEVADRVVRFLTDSRELRCTSLDISRQGQLAAGRRHIGPTRGNVALRGTR